MLTQISLMAKSPQHSMMPRLCLGKLLQFPTMVTCSKIRLFAATAWQSTFSYSGHTVIMNGAFHLQIQKCRAEEASLSPVAGGGRGGKTGRREVGTWARGVLQAKGWMGLRYPKSYCCISSYQPHT